MSKKVSQKELRRQAARREMESRSRLVESSVRQAALDADWGSAVKLAPLVRENLIRLGALPQGPTSEDAIETLIDGIKWPSDKLFRFSTGRFREQMKARGVPDCDAIPETEVQDAMPHRCTGFRFLPPDSRGSFYEGWQSDFAAIDPLKVVPFAVGSHFFYFVTANPEEPGDPLVLTVDHETAHESPANPFNSTVGGLLALLSFE